MSDAERDYSKTRQRLEDTFTSALGQGFFATVVGIASVAAGKDDISVGVLILIAIAAVPVTVILLSQWTDELHKRWSWAAALSLLPTVVLVLVFALWSVIAGIVVFLLAGTAYAAGRYSKQDEPKEEDEREPDQGTDDRSEKDKKKPKKDRHK